MQATETEPSQVQILLSRPSKTLEIRLFYDVGLARAKLTIWLCMFLLKWPKFLANDFSELVECSAHGDDRD